MSFIIAVEGGDGVGKKTLSTAMKSCLGREYRVTSFDFPRYGETLGGIALGDFLAGRTKAPSDSRVVATLYALDRFEFKDRIAKAIEASDFVIFDRYIASNMAYQAAKRPLNERFETMKWIELLETEMFGLPRPNLNILLSMPVEASMELILRKGNRSYTQKVYDIHEENKDLQVEIRNVYETMRRDAVLGSWLEFEMWKDGKFVCPDDVAKEIARRLTVSGQWPGHGSKVQI